MEHGANVSDAAWTFNAPAGTSIVAARLWRAGEARSSRPYGTTVYWLAAPNDSYDAADIFDKCGTMSGVGDISFSVADTGSGLYQAVFSIDGHAVSKQLLNTGSGPCRSVGGASDGANAFFEVEPCPLVF